MRRVTAGLLVLGMVVAGCGSRRSHDELMLAHQAGRTESIVEEGSPAEGLVGGEVAGTPTSEPGSTGDPSSGEDSTSVDGPGADGAPSGPRVANRSRIRIGVVGTLSGPAGEAFGPMAEGVQVWARWINDHGGLDGHPVDVVVGDDGGDPARHRSMVQEFVERRRVLAFVSNPEALTGGGSVEYLKSVGVPVIGSENAGQWFYESPVHFPQGSHGDALLQAGSYAGAQLMRAAGQTKIGTIVCSEVQACRDQYNTAPKQMQKYGMQVVYRAQVSLVQPDFTAECVAAQRAGAEVITIGLPANAVRSIARACARQGYRPTFHLVAGAVTADMKSDANLAGARVFSSTASWAASNTPATAEFQQAMRTYLPRVEAAGGHILSWTAAKILELAGKDLPDAPTSKDLLEALGRIHGDVLPELTGPLLYNPDRPADRSVCQFATLIDGGRFVPALGGQRLCTEFDPAVR